MSTYREDVLEKRVVVEYQVDDENGSSSFQMYHGTIKQVTIKYHNRKLQSYHFVVFDDGDQDWFDLDKLDRAGILQWPEKAAGSNKNNILQEEGDCTTTMTTSMNFESKQKSCSTPYLSNPRKSQKPPPNPASDEPRFSEIFSSDMLSSLTSFNQEAFSGGEQEELCGNEAEDEDHQQHVNVIAPEEKHESGIENEGNCEGKMISKFFASSIHVPLSPPRRQEPEHKNAKVVVSPSVSSHTAPHITERKKADQEDVTDARNSSPNKEIEQADPMVTEKEIPVEKENPKAIPIGSVGGRKNKRPRHESSENVCIPSSIDDIIRYMDISEPGMNYFRRQQNLCDGTPNCSTTRSRLRHVAKIKPNHPAVKHWVQTGHWEPPDMDALMAMIHLIKEIIEK